MFIERKVYPLGNNEFAPVYEITDLDHEVRLSSSEAWDLLEWLDQHRSEIFSEMHPESAPTFSQQPTEELAARDWHTRAIVRILETTTRGNRTYGRSERTFRAGEELEMVQWGRAGRTVERDAWWTSYDIDGAFIIDAGKVEVLRVLDETSPFD